MLLATIRDGRIEASGPIPNLWEGMTVQIVPIPPDAPDVDEDFTPDELERRLQVLLDMGPMEYEDGEREEINRALMDMDRLSREQVARQHQDFAGVPHLRMENWLVP